MLSWCTEWFGIRALCLQHPRWSKCMVSLPFFFFRISRLKSTDTSEYWMTCVFESFTRLIGCGIPFSFKFVRKSSIPLLFLSRTQKRPVSLQESFRVILDFLSILNTNSIISFHCPLYVVEHWHEHDLVHEFVRFNVSFSQIILDFLKNARSVGPRTTKTVRAETTQDGMIHAWMVCICLLAWYRRLSKDWGVNESHECAPGPCRVKFPDTQRALFSKNKPQPTRCMSHVPQVIMLSDTKRTLAGTTLPCNRPQWQRDWATTSGLKADTRFQSRSLHCTHHTTKEHTIIKHVLPAKRIWKSRQSWDNIPLELNCFSIVSQQFFVRKWHFSSPSWPSHVSIAPSASIQHPQAKDGIWVDTYFCLCLTESLDREIIPILSMKETHCQSYSHLESLQNDSNIQFLCDIEQALNFLEVRVLADLQVRQIIRFKMNGGFHRWKPQTFHISIHLSSMLPLRTLSMLL